MTCRLTLLVTILLLAQVGIVMGDEGASAPFNAAFEAEPGRITIKAAFPISSSTPPVTPSAPLSFDVFNEHDGPEAHKPPDREVIQAIAHEQAGIPSTGVVDQAEAAPPVSETASTVESPIERMERLAGAGNFATDATSPLEKLPRLLGMTLFVLILCGVTLLLGRRWLLRLGMPAGSTSSTRLRITATLPLPSQGRLHIIRVDNRDYLAGTDARGLQQLIAISPAFEDVLGEFDGDSQDTDPPLAQPSTFAPLTQKSA